MKGKTWLKVAGLAATVLGAAAGVVMDMVTNKQMEDEITEKVDEAIAKRTES